MEFNLLKLKIHSIKINSSSTELKDFSSTKGQDLQNPVIVNSQTAVSTTGSQIQNDNFIKNISDKKLFIRDILVGATGTIIGAVDFGLLFLIFFVTIC